VRRRRAQLARVDAVVRCRGRDRLGRGAEAEQTPAERDRRRGKPRPTEEDPGDHVREPMHVEQDPTRSHADRKSDGKAGQDGSGEVPSPAAEE